MIGATGVAEEEKSKEAVGPLAEIEGGAGRVGEDEARLGQGRRHDAAPEFRFTGLLPESKTGAGNEKSKECRSHVSFLSLNDDCAGHPKFVV